MGHISNRIDDSSTKDATNNVTDRQLEKYIEFFHLLGNAKQEPCGKKWTCTYADSAWRMAIMALCLPTDVDRKLLVKVSLVSAFDCFEKLTCKTLTRQESSSHIWKLLNELLPQEKAEKIYYLYLIHASAKVGAKSKSKEYYIYRKILDMEKTFLNWEQIQKEGVESKHKIQVFDKMAEVGFPGQEGYKMYKDASDFETLLNFFLKTSELKQLPRAGWLRLIVHEPERVSGHMYRMGVMAMLMEDENKAEDVEGESLRRSTLIVSIIHDMAECILGDSVLSDHITPDEKRANEKDIDAMKSLLKDIPSSTHSKEFFDWFVGYDKQNEADTKANLTKDLDRFDMVLQAAQYETQRRSEFALSLFLQELYDTTENYFKNNIRRLLDKQLGSISKDTASTSSENENTLTYQEGTCKLYN